MSEYMLVPILEEAEEAGIAVVNWDGILDSTKITSRVFHRFDGETGTNMIAEHFIKYGEETGRHINALVVWSIRGNEMQELREEGFLRPIKESPIIDVLMDTPETFCEDGLTATYVSDAFTAHPELNAMYVICGGASGCVEGLRAIDRLYPVGHPDHVLIGLNDFDVVPAEQILDDYVDCTLSHPFPDLADVPVKIMFTHLVLGREVPQAVELPMWLVTKDNIYEERYGAPLWPFLPKEQWDLWPILDTSELGIETPTAAKRMELLGY